MGRKLLPAQKEEPEGKPELSTADDDMINDNFDTESEPYFDITCNVVSVFPVEFDQVTEFEEFEEFIEAEMARHIPIYYYVMNNGCIKEKSVFFERPNE